MGLAPYRPLELMRNKAATRSDFQDFIAVWEGFVPKPFCEELIKYGDDVLNENTAALAVGTPQSMYGVSDGGSQYNGKGNRHDASFMVNYHASDRSSQINQFLKSCMMHYMDEYDQLKGMTMVSTDIKFQRTPAGGGYHLWHYENASHEYSHREVTWMIYLNDIEEGGETEFRFQKRRIKPTQGTVVLFPAAMTHVHKGNMVMGEDNKYIVTGWYIKTPTSLNN